MMRLFGLACAVMIALVCSSMALSQDKVAGVVAPPSKTPPMVQIAILLDTSNSMDGLIDQARTQLWSIVNEFVRAKRDGQSPRIQVALYEYGNNGLERQGNYIRQVIPLSDDLDAISDKLFSLKTNGGDEYCGAVIEHAARNLSWNPDPHVFKAIFIAGNEPFTQGPVDYRKSVPAALQKGIVVNTIHCGSESEARNGQWYEGARLGEGKALCIDQNRAVVAIVAPQDEQISKLSGELNTTYIPYGVHGKSKLTSQAENDFRAAEAAPSGAAVQRAVAKSSAAYVNSSWDLVDAARTNAIDLDKTDVKDLPENMQKMTPEQRKAYLAEQQGKRESIQKQIQSLTAEREKYIASQRKEQNGPDTLDVAFKKAIQEQLKDRQFEVQK